MTRLSVDLDPDVEQMIDNWRSAQVKVLKRIPSKKEAINILLKEALKK